MGAEAGSAGAQAAPRASDGNWQAPREHEQEHDHEQEHEHEQVHHFDASRRGGHRLGPEAASQRRSVASSRMELDDGGIKAAPAAAKPKPGPSVEATLREFANEVARWRRTDRADAHTFPAHLEVKYLRDRLGDMPPAKMVNIARKAISLEVEKLRHLQPKPPARPNARPRESSESNEPPPSQTPNVVVASLPSAASSSLSKFEDLMARCSSQQDRLQQLKQ